MMALNLDLARQRAAQRRLVSCVNTVLRATKRLLNRNDGLLNHAMIVSAAGFAGNVLNYLYQLAMGRMLGPEQYGVLGALISLTYVMAVPTETIKTVMAKLSSELQAGGRIDDLGHVIRHFGLRVVLASSVGLLLIIAASGGIAKFLRLPSVVPALILGPIFFFGLLSLSLIGCLLGLQRFAQLGLVQIVSFAVKLVLAIALVGLGFGVPGALAAIPVGAGFGLLLSILLLRGVLRRPPITTRIPRITSNVVSTLLGFLFLALLYNVDVILARRFFAATEAGYYAAAATVARGVYLGSIAIALAMFPKATAWSERGNPAGTRRLLGATMLYVGLIAGFGALILSIFPETAVSLLLGAGYAESAPLVGLLSVAMFFLSLSHVLVMYQLALGSSKFLPVLIVGVGAEAGALLLFHETLQQVAMVMVAGTAGVLACLLLAMSIGHQLHEPTGAGSAG